MVINVTPAMNPQIINGYFFKKKKKLNLHLVAILDTENV